MIFSLKKKGNLYIKNVKLFLMQKKKQKFFFSLLPFSRLKIPFDAHSPAVNSLETRIHRMKTFFTKLLRNFI